MAGNAVIGALRVNLGLDSAEFQTGIKQVQSSLAGIGKAFAGLAALGVFTAFSDQIGQAVGRIEEMRKLSAQLDKALSNTGNTAKTSAGEVASFADELEKSTGRAAEEVMAVSTNLATFGFNRQVFFEAIELADDMSAAWGGDLKQNVEGLARALADPEKGLAMLTKRGITFTDQQKAMIASFMQANDLLGAQGVILDTLQEQVSGVAEAGFSGLTKATANAWLGMEEFFEAIANGLQLNLGLELGLIAVTSALGGVTKNMGALGRVVAVAGIALTTAMGPAIWTAISTAAVAFGQAAVGAIRAVGIAIASNPIGAIVVGFSAAVSAAFLFRDEIKQAIGIDFVGIVENAGNKLIGIFVGAYDAVKEAWGNLPTFFSGLGKKAWNSFVESFEGPALTIDTPWGSWESAGLELSGAKSALSREEMEAFGRADATFDKGFNRNYLGEMFSGVSDEVAGATANVQGFGDILAETSTGGGAGVDGLKAKVGGLTGALATAKDSMSELWSSMKSGLTGIATGVTKAFFATEDAAGKALDAIVSGLDQVASKALDMAFSGIFDMLLGAFGGNSLGGGWGKAGGFSGFAGIFGIPGAATGGRVMSEGLVEVGERGRELVHLPAGAQIIRNSDIGDIGGGTAGGNTFHIDARGAQQGVGAEIAQALADFSANRLPGRVAQINRNPFRRGGTG